jgi:hypothetical protein
MRNPRVRLNCESITACEPEIQEMIDALLNPLPVPACGVATASWLLCNGAGPIYNGHSPEELSIAVREAIEHLDPGMSLQVS